MDDRRLNQFLESLFRIEWFQHAGEASKEFRSVESLQSGWDRENERMLGVWLPRTHALESKAQAMFSDPGIDEIFSRVSEAIQDRLYDGLCSYLNRKYGSSGSESWPLERSVDESLLREVMDSVKRDVCWACVEYMLEVHDFFNTLLSIYRTGRWPCSWDGEYPGGQPVIL